MGLTATTPGFWLPWEWVRCPPHWQNFVRLAEKHGVAPLELLEQRYGGTYNKHFLNHTDYDCFVGFESESCYVSYLLENNHG